jgi:hypothetical protein
MSDPTKEDYSFAIGAIMVLLVVLCVALVGWAVCASWWDADSQAFKVEAVRHGAAEWRTDAEGKTSFHWLDNRKEKP